MVSFFFIVVLKDWFDNGLVLVISFKVVNEKMRVEDCHNDTKTKKRYLRIFLHIRFKKMKKYLISKK